MIVAYNTELSAICFCCNFQKVMINFEYLSKVMFMFFLHMVQVDYLPGSFHAQQVQLVLDFRHGCTVAAATNFCTQIISWISGSTLRIFRFIEEIKINRFLNSIVFFKRNLITDGISSLKYKESIKKVFQPALLYIKKRKKQN